MGYVVQATEKWDDHDEDVYLGAYAFWTDAVVVMVQNCIRFPNVHTVDHEFNVCDPQHPRHKDKNAGFCCGTRSSVYCGHDCCRDTSCDRLSEREWEFVKGRFNRKETILSDEDFNAQLREAAQKKAKSKKKG
jgi:hypothetical protein